MYWREQHKEGNAPERSHHQHASDSGLLGNLEQSNYGAAKAAAGVLSIIIDREMAKYGVTVNAIAPWRARASRSKRPRRPRRSWGTGERGSVRRRSARQRCAARRVARERRRRGRARRGLPRGRRHGVADAGLALAGKVKQRATGSLELGGKLKAELAKGATRKESMNDVFAEGM